MQPEHPAPITGEQIEHAVFYCRDLSAKNGRTLTVLALVLEQLSETGLWDSASLRKVRDRVIASQLDNPPEIRPVLDPKRSPDGSASRD